MAHECKTSCSHYKNQPTHPFRSSCLFALRILNVTTAALSKINSNTGGINNNSTLMFILIGIISSLNRNLPLCLLGLHVFVDSICPKLVGKMVQSHAPLCRGGQWRINRAEPQGAAQCQNPLTFPPKTDPSSE